jgi:hypothetical protein
MPGVEDDPSAEETMAALLAAEFLTIATNRLLGAGVPRDLWPGIMMKAFLLLCDLGEKHAGVNTPSVRKLLDLARAHLGLPSG